MLKDELTDLLMDAMKQKDAVKVSCLKAIKAAILNYEKSPHAEPLTEAIERSIIKKLIKQREDSIEVYVKANRLDLAEDEKTEMDCLMEFVPAAASREEILHEYTAVTATQYEATKANMGKIIKAIKESLPNADGKTVADIVKLQLPL